MDAVKKGLIENPKIGEKEGQGDRDMDTGVVKKNPTEKCSRGGKKFKIS